MTVRNSLLALLAQESTHGYGLKSNFEKSTAGTWLLNVGQVYTTLARLERDGLVKTGAARADRRQPWRLTRKGLAALSDWYDSPVTEDPPSRDELAIKVLLAIAASDVNVTKILHRQRVATMERLKRYRLQKQEADPEHNLAWVLMLDALSLRAEAEVKWLDLCEERLRHRGA